MAGLDSQRAPIRYSDTIFGGLGGQGVTKRVNRVQPGTPVTFVAFSLFPLHTASVFPMTLVGAPIVFNCGGAMYIDATACLHKIGK